MNEAELSQIVEAKLEAELEARLQADRQRIRLEVVDQIRRAAEKAHYDKINARAPIEDQYGGIGREAHEARLKAMRINAARDAEHMRKINAAPVEGSLAYTKQRASIVGTGGEGFEIRPVRRS
jgi:hypothetical protein